jgi:hypothetical protein
MKAYDSLQDPHRDFIARQHVFFVASAPLAADGHVNVSPKGLDSFAVLDASTVAYLDLGGSGIETHAHVLENGRLCVMFCAFEGDPYILRLYGRGRTHPYGTPTFDELRPQFPAITVPVRGVIELDITRVQDSCGWGVPLFDYREERSRLLDHNAKRDQDAFFEARLRSNAESLDGLPGLSRP